MFVVHRAAEGAALAAGLAEVLRTPPSDPFAGDVVAVPAKGVERWLAQRLSHVLGSDADGSDGVCANVRFPSVTTLVDEALEPVTPADAVPAWSPARLLWPLLAELDACPPDEPWCAPLVQHLGAGTEDKGRRLRVASKLAGLYDAYAQSRPEMVRAWAVGDDTRGDGLPLDDDVRWQAELWRRLRARVGCRRRPSCSTRRATRCAPARSSSTSPSGSASSAPAGSPALGCRCSRRWPSSATSTCGCTTPRRRCGTRWPQARMPCAAPTTRPPTGSRTPCW